MGDVITELSGEGTDSVTSSVSFNLLTNGANVEKLTLTGTALVATANDSGDTLIGNGMNNTLNGGAGNDVLNGMTGADTMNGGAGNDTYYVDNAGDVITDTSGTDTVIASITYSIASASGIENLTLGGSSAISGTGNSGDNTMTGNAAINTLNGGGGNDTIDGKGGADTMVGGTGNDTYYVDNVKDVVTELASEGTDTVNSTITYSLVDTDGVGSNGGNVENLNLLGTANINATGNGVANVINGNAGNNVIDGGAGADTMAGGAGNDTYVVDNVGDTVTEGVGAGNDTVSSSIAFDLSVNGANVENLTLTGAAAINGTGNSLDNVMVGNDAANTLDGGAGNDTFNGAGGNDIIIGGAGVDQLAGGAGNDTFTFKATTESGTTVLTEDVIQDFFSTQDHIDLSVIDGNTTLAGIQHLTFAASGTAQGTLVVTSDGAGGTLVSVWTTHSGGTADMIFDVAGVASLSASDFVL